VRKKGKPRGGKISRGERQKRYWEVIQIGEVLGSISSEERRQTNFVTIEDLGKGKKE